MIGGCVIIAPRCAAAPAPAIALTRPVPNRDRANNRATLTHSGHQATAPPGRAAAAG